MRTSFWVPICTVPVLFFLGCSDDKRDHARTPRPVQLKVETNSKPSAPIAAPYQSFVLTGAKSLADLSRSLGDKKMHLVYALNRRDLQHLKVGDTIAIPNDRDSILYYSPFPLTISGLDSVHKLLLVSRRVQAFGAYANGRLVLWGPTSTGKKATPTPERLYYTNWKARETHSTVDDAWVLKWSWNLDNLEGISMHEYSLPGYPASHSCVRLLSEDAQWMYQWADQWKLAAQGGKVVENGTPVIVFGEYAYGKPPPWKKLLLDPHSTDVSSEEAAAAIDKYLPKQVAPPKQDVIPIPETKLAPVDSSHATAP